MNLLITRGQEDAEPLARLLEEQGHKVLIDPLFSVSFKSTAPIDPSGVRGLLVTSANGIRAFASQTWVGQNWKDEVAVYAVGDASAKTAAALGFKTVYTASGDVDALTELVIKKAPLDQGAFLHIAGTKVAGDLAGRLVDAGFEYKREVMYEAIAASCLAKQTRRELEQGLIDGILFYSPRTVDIFVTLAQKEQLVVYLERLQVYCMSPAVASRVSDLRWAGVQVASRPDQLSMLALIGKA